MKLSVIIPVYNEALAIREILLRVHKAPLPESFSKEVILVDDGSTDETTSLIEDFLQDHPDFAQNTQVHKSLINHGKGAALRAGFELATGDIILVQDGDLEYNPNNYPDLLRPFLEENADVVYGSRFTKGFPKGMHFLNLLANLILTYTTRLLFGAPVTDEATCYKVFRRSILKDIKLKCRGFEFCPEFTGEIFRKRNRYIFKEVPIDYNPRGLLEGKKITASDGFIAFWILLKKRFK